MSGYSYDFIYYSALLILLAGYLLTFKVYHIGSVSSFFLFRNASIAYYAVFAILLGKPVYDGSALATAEFNERLYFLMLYYGVALVAVGIYFNSAPAQHARITQTYLNVIPLLLVLLLKALLFTVSPTPLQTLLTDGLIEANLQQIEWHQPGGGGIVRSFYLLFGPAMMIVFFVYFMNAKSSLVKLAMFLLAFETGGFYLSKAGMFTAVLICMVLSGVRLKYLVMFAATTVLAVFAIRVGSSSLWSRELLSIVFERFVLETGYANVQLDLYQGEYPPLVYESRYFIGFNTLFGITPAVDASREAYLMETGRFGATSSGHAAVSLYAFWGYAFFLVTPILLAGVFYMDRLVTSWLRTTFDLVAYVVVSFRAINYLTVDIQRLVSFQTVVDLSFLFSIVLILIARQFLTLPIFTKPIRISGGLRAQHV